MLQWLSACEYLMIPMTMTKARNLLSLAMVRSSFRQTCDSRMLTNVWDSIKLLAFEDGLINYVCTATCTRPQAVRSNTLPVNAAEQPDVMVYSVIAGMSSSISSSLLLAYCCLYYHYPIVLFTTVLHLSTTPQSHF